MKITFYATIIKKNSSLTIVIPHEIVGLLQLEARQNKKFIIESGKDGE
ncbi:unnamed protein product [marine sediment metagenome]|uniref:SpoVT-AbrB domain-containing protein n=1 Tax=marine sediment metagenome TaxID=412755 RepID=X0ZB04_9ZZZZ